ncbi:minichromosome maintenance (MCM) complex subunit [Angomonas deanei]|uniref:Uncharacterized protein n=1 Tax=Angomonas deanei TaxID=59799 RepID=A0A7G2CIU7_9TRYP|nr:minichromosome maintenance (MCM) complex subunit [Angomonas deanei]CAD2218977.1 hypothetical protein, conserved [Angomonas deanei]|eukprot:EPY23436.1 minichromosome maintenance (MCM) complex subunit [Angomonas deanei]
MRSVMENRFKKYLDAETEPIPFIQHKIKVAIQSLRHFEKQISGGVEPTTVRIDVSELERYTANISKEALNAYFASEAFLNEYTLIRDPTTQAPLQVEHVLY